MWYYVLAPNVIISFWSRLPLTNILHSSKFDTNFWDTVPFVTLCLGMVLNVTISWHGTTVTILQSPITMSNADTRAKYDTVVHDNICGTKCNYNWYYPGNDAKYDIIFATVLLLCSYSGNGAKCIFRLFVYQSSLWPRCVRKIHR